MPTPERRRAPRIAQQLSLTISNGGFALSTETRNLSATGAYCSVERFIPPMTKLQLRLELPEQGGTTTVECIGVVVRVEPTIHSAERAGYDMAVYFTELSDRDRAAIERFVRQRLGATSV